MLKRVVVTFAVLAIVAVAACAPPGAKPTLSPLPSPFVSPLPTGSLPSPFVSPLRLHAAATFASPLVKPVNRTPRFDSVAIPLTYYAYLPLVMAPPPRIGVGMSSNHPDCSYLSQVGADWYYDWTPEPLPCPNAQAVPMLFAPEQVGASVSDSEYLLMFNEPDLARRTPEEIAIAWHTVELLYPERKLIGPNISHLGLEWLFAWRRAYIQLYATSPTVWALGVHCYMPVQECKDWTTVNIALAKTWTQSGRVWVTEWASPPCLYPNMAQTLANADVFMTWLLANPDVEREAYFHAYWRERECNTDLFNAGGMTAFGWWHRAAAGVR